MDAFQGYLKDGTNGTQDCRQFAAAYLISSNPWIVYYMFLPNQLLHGLYYHYLSIILGLTML